MQSIEQALQEVRALHEQVTRTRAPEIGPQAFLPFPLGQDPVAYAIEEVSQLKQLVQSRRAGAAPSMHPQPQWVPRASVYAGESVVSFLVELPGVAKEDVSITVCSGELTVRGERKPVTIDGELRPVVIEQAWGAFERRFPLPSWAAPETITARYAQGVLEIHVSRDEDDAPGEFRVEIG